MQNMECGVRNMKPHFALPPSYLFQLPNSSIPKLSPVSPIRLLSQQLLKHHRQGGNFYFGGQLKIVAEVTNRATVKTVGIRYTDDDWLTWKERDGIWCSHDERSEVDQFLVLTESTLAAGVRIEYALYCRVNESTWWDNNNSANYSAQF